MIKVVASGTCKSLGPIACYARAARPLCTCVVCSNQVTMQNEEITSGQTGTFSVLIPLDLHLILQYSGGINQPPTPL